MNKNAYAYKIESRVVENKPVVFYFDTGGIELRENAFSFRPTVKLDTNLERGKGIKRGVCSLAEKIS